MVTPLLMPVCVVYRMSPVAAVDAVSMALLSAVADGSPGVAGPVLAGPIVAWPGRVPRLPEGAPPGSRAIVSPASAAAVAMPMTSCGQRGDRGDGRALAGDCRALARPGRRRAPASRTARSTVSALGARSSK